MAHAEPIMAHAEPTNTNGRAYNVSPAVLREYVMIYLREVKLHSVEVVLLNMI